MIQPPAERFKPWSVDDVLTTPPTRPLWHGMVDHGSTVLIYGKWGSGKTHLGLGLSANMALGVGSFLGRELDAGSVLYACGEGRASFRNRLDALRQQHREADWRRLNVVLNVPQLAQPNDVDLFLEQVGEAGWLSADLVVVDTVSKAMVGLDDNARRDVGLLFEGVDRLREELGSTVILVHHEGHLAGRARGSSAFGDNVDTIIGLKNEAGVRTATILKQRDGVEGVSASFRLQESGPSAVVVVEETPSRRLPLSPAQLRILKVLAESPTTMAFTEIVTRADVAKSTVFDALKAFHLHGCTEKVDRGYRVTDAGVKEVLRAAI